MPCFEIHGTGTHNRGAELMAIAIAQETSRAYPDSRIFVPGRFGSKRERERHGFGLSADVFKGRFRRLNGRIPEALLAPFGVTPSRQVGAVLDASGFAFSDQWGPSRAQYLLDKMQLSSREHQKLILMPQALGPFENPQVRDVVKRLFSRASLVFARDEKSFNFCKQLGSETRIEQAPDFTIDYKPDRNLDLQPFDLPATFFAIVPNIHMVRKTDDMGGEKYFHVLSSVSKRLVASGLQPLVLLHDSSTDHLLLPDIARFLPNQRVVTSQSPVELKAILGQAAVVVGSRFHALVAALSQGVPTLGLGWSHKYQCLFREFGCEELILRSDATESNIEQAVDVVTTDEERSNVRASLSQTCDLMGIRIKAMWQEVFDVLQAP